MDWLTVQNTGIQPFTPPSSSESFYEPGIMRVAYFSNEFPSDDLQGLLRNFQLHSKKSSFPVLARFLQEATIAVKEEVQHLSTALKKSFPPFQSILQLAEHADLRAGPLGGSIDGVLLCTVQLSALVGYYESSPGESFDASVTDTFLTGLGIGLLTTAAVSLAPTLADVPRTGAEVVRLAFRLGVLVDEVSQNLKPFELTPDPTSRNSWAYAVPNVDSTEVQKELDYMHETESTPAPSKIFISAINRNSVTVSGPPAKLKHMFLHSDFFRDRKWIALPVYSGLCHAQHIYGPEHVDRIVKTASPESLDSRFTPHLPVYSTSTGKPFAAKSAQELHSSIIREILTQKIQWDDVVSSIVQRTNEVGAPGARVFIFRQSLPANELISSLSKIDDFQVKTTDLIAWINKPTVQSAPRGTAQSKLAIVGMSCRLPGARSTEEFWKILEEGLDMSRVIPADRFDVETHYDPTGKQLNKTMTQYGCFIEEPGMFDAAFFNMSPREAQVVDPQMRLALVTAYEALEQAGVLGGRTAATKLERIGTYYGQAADDYREVNQGQEVSTYYIPGGCRAFGPGRINYFFKFAGPSYSIDTACSSGLAAVEVACQALWSGDIDTAVAGGVNILTNPDGFAGLCNGHFLTKGHNACKTWDATADGYCRADGVGSLVIKRLEDAEADNDNILGVILGAGTNHSAQAVSITHPHAGHQAYLSRQILRQAGVDPLDVSYVELHGTGTQAGDSEEMEGIMSVYAPLHPRRTKSLYIGASKANIGHGESVAGTTALIKTLLMLQKNMIPKHIGIKTEINPKFPKDFAKRNLHIPLENVPWPQGKNRTAVVNNFGAAGGNTTMVLEEAPEREITTVDPRQTHVVNISAKSKVSLKGNLERIITYLESNPDVSLGCLGYTTTARRYAHNHRISIASSNVTHLKKQLSSYLDKADSHVPIPSTGAPPVVFAFTGQGASHRSMSIELFRDGKNGYFHDQMLHLNSIAVSQGFPSFIPAIDGSHPQDYAHSPVITQLALTCTEIALAKYWISLGVQPEAVVGHSLGEYAALCIAGVLLPTDAIFLVGRRAEMLQERCQQGSHKMLAVRASVADVATHVGDKLPYEIACINGPTDTVLSGTSEQISAVAELLGSSGFKCFPLDVAFAFHSSQTDPILDDFEIAAKTAVTFHPPTVPIISPLLGKVIYDEKTVNANYLRRATRETVHFLPALEAAQEMETIDETMVWVECGPHPVCLGFVKSTLPSVNAAVPSLRRGEDSWQTMATSLAILHCTGITIDWNEFHRPFESALRLLDIPTYAWNEKNYWLQYQGDWCLTKGNSFYSTDGKSFTTVKSIEPAAVSDLRTSLVQKVVKEEFSDSAGWVTMRSDLMEPDFFAATWGHQMNGCGVATSSIHADIAYTLGGYLMGKLKPRWKDVALNVCNLEVVKGLVASKDKTTPQLIEVTAQIDDVEAGVAFLHWHTVSVSGEVSEPFATANIIYGLAQNWLDEWAPTTHLVQGRIEALERLADQGIANRLSHNMAYRLFAQNLVNYATKYRGMQSVVMHELEAFADITLTQEKGGVWTVPPYLIDSVAHHAGFVMNVSDANDTENNFFVTPGWGEMRFARPLTPGSRYRSYVKMIPTKDDPTVFLGNVYILQDDIVIGLVTAIKFRRYPRILLDRFFSTPEAGLANSHGIGTNASTATIKPQAKPSKQVAPSTISKPSTVRTTKPIAAEVVPIPNPASKPVQETSPPATTTVDNPDSVAVKAIKLVADEAGLEVADLTDDQQFQDLGVDSLMSLVIAEKFRETLGVSVTGSLFLEYPSIGDLRAWLLEYYN